MRIGFLVPGGLTRVTGGTIYDRHLVHALRGLGATVDELPLAARSYAGALADNLRPWPPGAWDVLLQDELGHPALVARNARAPGRVVALVHNLRVPPVADGAEPRSVRVVRALERRYLRATAGIVAVCDATLADVRALLAGGARTSRALPPCLVLRAGRDHAPTRAPETRRFAAAPESASESASESAFNGASERAFSGASSNAFNGASHGAARPLRLLAVAAVAPHKGLHRLIDVLAAVRARARADEIPVEVTLEIAGSLVAAPAYAQALVARIAAAGLGARVHLLGELRDEALWAAYRRADVAVLPSDREAYPLACIEALGFGLPVLVTNRGGAGELVTDGREGFLLAPDDPRAWSDAIAMLARDRARTLALSTAALARYATLDTWRDAATKLLAFLETLR